MNEKANVSPRVRLAWATAIVAALGLLAAGLPFLGLLLMFTGIGAPLGMLYLALPTVAFVVVPAMLIYMVSPGPNALKAIAALVATPIMLCLPPAILNPPIQADAEELVSGDFNALSGRLNPKSVAFRRKTRFEPGVTRCDELCLSTLLSGAAERVVVPVSNEPSKDLDPSEPATEYSLQSQGRCTPHKLARPTSMGQTFGQPNSQPIDVVDLMNLVVGDGLCLVEKPTVLKAADYIISWTKLRVRSEDTQAPFANMTNATRASIFEAGENTADIKEIYRQTEVSYKLFRTFLVPIRNLDHPWINVTHEFHRIERYLGRSLSGPNAERAIVSDVAGIRLDQGISALRKRFRDNIGLATLTDQVPSATRLQMILSYYDQFAWWVDEEPTKRQLKLILGLFENSNLPPLPQLYFAVQNLIRHEPEEAPRLATLLFDRLQRGQTWSDDWHYGTKEALESVVTAIGQLPDTTAAPHVENLLDRMKTEATQTSGPRLADAVYRDGVVPLFLNLVERNMVGSDATRRKSLTDALRGLCYAGDRASEAASSLNWWIDAKRLPTTGGHAALLVRTLARLGGAADEIRPRFIASKHRPSQVMVAEEIALAQAGGHSCD